MRRLLLLTAICALACVPATAIASRTWTIKGAGFGHGIGMSQYGAYGLAQHGYSYRDILGHYYAGTQLGSASGRSIRVLLAASVGRVSFTGATRVGNRGLKPAKTYVAKRHGANVELRDSAGKPVGHAAGPVSVSSSRGYVTLGGSNYRGTIELRPGTSGGVTAINVVGLDNYVQGVVPGEMPSNWSSEALKAQAVAARSYALATDAGGAVFDQFADTRSQVYKGMSGEAASTNAAVQATAGQVVMSGGNVATTYFFSTSGGQTEDVQNVFYGAIAAPYLKSVGDPYDNIAPRHRWQFGPYSRHAITKKFGGMCKGAFRSLTVTQRGSSPRIVNANVVCSRGTDSATGASLRSRLGLYDTWFRVVQLDSTGTARSKSLGALGKALFPRAVYGAVSPAPRAGAKVVVERLVHGRWRRAARGKIGDGGSYNVPVKHSGVYRVRVSGITGPRLTVR